MRTVLEDERVVVEDESTNEECTWAMCSNVSTHVAMCLRCGTISKPCTPHALLIASHRRGMAGPGGRMLSCPTCKLQGFYPEHFSVDPR